jgi:hypothetical protein
MFELVLYSCSIFLFFAFAAGLAWVIDKTLTFHFEGMERLRKLKAKEEASE